MDITNSNDIEDMRQRGTILCDNMILHLNSGLSQSNIHIIKDIADKIETILDSVSQNIKKIDLTEKKELKKHTMNLRSSKKGILEILGDAPKYSYYNHPL